ncbi:keratin, type I cytoskeletal 18 [Sigmodon hispidus]
MSFTTRFTTFSTNYRSQGSVWTSSQRVRPASSTASVYAGAGGSGSRISVSRSASVWGGPVGSAGLVGMGGIQTEKETMQELNDRLTSYLDRVKSLETENRRLESKIREHLEKKGSQGARDWGHYFKTIEDPKTQIFANSVDMPESSCRSIMLDLLLTSESMDDTNNTRLQLETETEALKEELLFMKKNHEEEVKGLEAQIASSGLTVEYEQLAQKNREKLDKYWSQQIEESTTVVTTQSAEIRDAEITLTDLKHTFQALEIDRDAMKKQKISLENILRDVEARYVSQMEQFNGVLLHLESELAQTRAEGQHQTQEYEVLLNIKVKLEAEIATYRRLLEDGEDFSLNDALNSSNSMQTVQRKTTRKVVDGKQMTPES